MCERQLKQCLHVNLHLQTGVLKLKKKHKMNLVVHTKTDGKKKSVC